MPLVAAAFLQACSPCAAVESCSSSLASFTADGQLVRAETGRGVDGVRIDMIRVGGRGITQIDSVSTVTSGGGFWRLSSPSIVPDSALFQFRIYSPQFAQPYTVFRWVVATARKGDALVTDRWVIDPYFPYIVQLYRRGRPDQVYPQIAVTFHQTAGAPLRGTDAKGELHFVADASGVVPLFLLTAFGTDTGFVTGQLIADLPAPLGRSSTSVSVYAATAYHSETVFLRASVGPSLHYAVALTDTAGKPAIGVRIDFQRTGGIEVDPASFSVVADGDGRIVLPLVPAAPGTLTGNVTLTAPNGSTRSFVVSLPTFDTDDTPLFATWSIGATTP